MWIQIILVIGILFIGFFLARRSGRDSHLALRRLGMLAFVVAAIVSVLFPAWLTQVAHVLGVGRGADLLLYALVLAFLTYVVATHRRHAQTDRRITKLARQLALAEARAEDESSHEVR